MNQQFNGLDTEDVISVYEGHVFVNSKTFTVNEFMAAIKQANKGVLGEVTDEKQKWFGEGLDCKLLKPGAKTWQRGKVRVRLEFCPEELEVTPEVNGNNEQNGSASPLDDIRKFADKAN
ncbi:KGK domain-containing protein [Merismopedia glauca]|uniref:KGK family protein n=1 Tax=Merismopedia glauca CCAP 1448/3 TaxID=1296344 RepID=A0A2T1C999_9CYAN|nr:KGK domain-containing protein [Merismopedia glauca]PSB04738.1 KGK family protein [Merismopedia glauca CCAP 1448/3]